MTEAKPLAPVRSLRRVLIGGTIWMVCARWGIRCIGLVSTMVLARLLVPADFGLVAMASIVLGLVEVLFAYGVDAALIQNQRAGREHFDTAWTVGIIQGALIVLALLVTAPLAASFFKDPRVVDILHVLSLAIVARSFGNIGVVAFRKELRFEKEFQLLVVGKLLAFAATITLAFVLRNFWALVIGTVVGSVLTCAQSYAMHPYRPRLSLRAVRSIWGFSQWMLLVNMSNFCLAKADEVVVGGQGDGAALGIYSIASEVAELPTTELAFPLSRTLLPGYAMLKDDPGRLKEAFLNVLGFVATVSVGGSLGIALIAHDLVPLLLGDKWLETIPLIQCLAIFAAIRTMYGGAGNLLVVLGKMRLLAALSWVQVTLTVCAVLVGIQVLGTIGVALGKLAVAPVFFGLLFWSVIRATNISRQDVAMRIWRPIVAGCAMAIAFHWFDGIAPLNHFTAVAAGVLFGASVYTGTLFALWYVSGKPTGTESFLLGAVKLMTRR